MRKLVIILLIISPLILAGQAHTSGVHTSLNPQKVTINVFFEGYNPRVDSFRYLKLIYFPLYNGITTAIPYEIDSNGKASITFPLISSQEIMLLAEENMVMMYAVPGHTTNIYFDLAALKTHSKLPYPETVTTPLSVRFSGSFSRFNQHFSVFWPKLPAILPYDNQKKMIDSLEQTAYKSYRLMVMKRMLDTLRVFNRNQNTSSEFREAITQYIHYWAAEDLLRYGWLHRPGKWEPLTKDYLDFLKKIPINNTKALVTGKYAAFLREYLEMWKRGWKSIPIDVSNERLYNFLKMGAKPISPEDELALKTPINGRDTVQKTLVANLYYQYQAEYGNFINNLNMLGSLVQQLPSGIGTDIMQARIITDYLIQFRQPLSSQNMELISRRIGNKDICTLVKKDNERLRNELAGKSSHDQKPDQFKLRQEQLYQKLIAPYHGKIIYIDFWAPWCGPCVKEIPASKVLAKELKEKDVVFLYVGVECDKNVWEKTIKKMFDGGEHYYADKNESVLLEAKFNFSGIPHYVLIDREGNVSDKDAPAPGNAVALKNKIFSLLGNSQ